MNIADLKGLGPKSTETLATIGITSAEEPLADDAFEVYATLKAQQPNTDKAPIVKF